MYPIVSPLQIELCDGSDNQWQLLNDGFAGIQAKGLFFSQGQLLHAEIRIQDKALTHGELVVIGEEFLEDDKAEIFCDIVFLQGRESADHIQLSVLCHLLYDLSEKHAYLGLNAEAQPEFYTDDLVIHQLFHAVFHRIGFVCPLHMDEPVHVGPFGIVAENRIEDLLLYLIGPVRFCEIDQV